MKYYSTTNFEQAEAFQAEANRKLKEYVDKQPEEVQKAYSELERAMKVLTDAGIPAYVFAMAERDKFATYFNNVIDVLGIEENPEEKASDFNICLFASMLSVIGGSPYYESVKKIVVDDGQALLHLFAFFLTEADKRFKNKGIDEDS